MILDFIISHLKTNNKMNSRFRHLHIIYRPSYRTVITAYYTYRRMTVTVTTEKTVNVGCFDGKNDGKCVGNKLSVFYKML